MTSTSIYNSGIYAIVNKKSGRSYIGSSINIEKRWKTHLRSLRKNTHHNIFLQRAFNKYGEIVFGFSYLGIMITPTQEELFESEQSHIHKCPHKLYNLGSVGGGDNLTNHPNKDDIRQRITNTNRNNNAQLSIEELSKKYGRCGADNGNYRGGTGFNSFHYCPICNISVISDSAKVCTNCRDRTGVNNTFYGKTHSKETLEKLRISNIGRTKSQYEIDSISGENSSKFKGYYHTPWGTFPAANQAKAAHSYMSVVTITRWCEYPDNDIVRLGASKYLQEIGLSAIGKTYRELGFSFTPK